MHPDNLQRSLEAELAANPDDLATHAAYGDLLSEQGDPRGEFIQVQLALDDADLEPDRRRELQAREQKLLQTHQRAWLGPLAPHLLDPDGGVRFYFSRGWLETLACENLSLPLARALRDAPQARLLRELHIVHAEDDEAPPQPDEDIPAGEYQRGFWPLVGSAALANVRHCTLGEDDGGEWDGYHNQLVTSVIPLLVRSMPRLEELCVFAGGYSSSDLFALPTLHSLRTLQIHHLAVVYRLDVLANNPACGHLTQLLLHPHALAWHRNRKEDEAAGFREEGGYLPLSVVKPLLHSPRLARLMSLRLRVSSMGDEGSEEIVRSGILRHLQFLDLRHGRITDRGADALAGCPDIRRLELLDLDRNALSAEGVRRLGQLGIPLRADDQHSGGDEYLCEGDYE